MFLSANAGGLIADYMRARSISITTVRKTMQTIGFLGPAVFLALVAATSTPALAVAYMTAALALGSFSQSGVYSNHQDIGPAYSGILLGIRYVFFQHHVMFDTDLSYFLFFFLNSNTGAAIPGIVGVALTGFILDTTGSWNLVFGIAMFFYILGTIAYNALGTGERVF